MTVSGAHSQISKRTSLSQTGPAAIKVTAPSARQTWEKGNKYPIRWESRGVPGEVTIFLLRQDMPASQVAKEPTTAQSTKQAKPIVVVGNTANIGSYDYVVPERSPGRDLQSPGRGGRRVRQGHERRDRRHRKQEARGGQDASFRRPEERQREAPGPAGGNGPKRGQSSNNRRRGFNSDTQATNNVRPRPLPEKARPRRSRSSRSRSLRSRSPTPSSRTSRLLRRRQRGPI